MLGSYSNCGADLSIKVQSDLAQNITFRSNYLQIDPRTLARRAISLDAVGGTIRDNYIDAIVPTYLDPGTSDSQAISGNPIGTLASPIVVDNNVVIGTTTTITFGGTPPLVVTPQVASTSNGVVGWYLTSSLGAQFINITNNHIWHHPYSLTVPWSANTWFRKGQAVRPSAGYAGKLFIMVNNAGQSGSTEPDWAGMGAGTTLADGGATWFYNANQWNDGDCSYGVKNAYESKSGVDITLNNNFIDRVWAGCATGGNQGRAITPENQTSGNGGGSASTFTNFTAANNIATNIGQAFNSLGQYSFDDLNRFPRFFTSITEPYTIVSGSNNSLNISVDEQAPVTITLTAGTRSASQIAADINAQGNASRIAAVAYSMPHNDATVASCTNPAVAGANCRVLIMRATAAHTSLPAYSPDAIPNPWNASTGTAISIGPAAGTNATTALGLPANGTPVYACTNPLSLIWYGCGRSLNTYLVNNIFQMRHDGIYMPTQQYVGLLGSGISNFVVDHNIFHDPTGWTAFNALFATASQQSVAPVKYWGQNGVLISNNFLADVKTPNAGGGAHYIGDTTVTAVDWSGINFACQSQAINATMNTGGDLAAECDAKHLLGGFTKNLAYNIPFTNAACAAGLTCNTSPAPSDIGFNAQPNDNFNADPFSTLRFNDVKAADYTLMYDPQNLQPYVQPAKYGTDNRPLGVDMTQMNFVRLAGGSPRVSDRAAVFSMNVTPNLQSKSGMLTIATDPFCFSPVSDMDPAQFTNPGWTGNDRYPQFGATRTAIVGMNTALSPNTTYYYCLEYQGYSLDGQFTTKPALSGTRTMQVQTALTSATPGASGATSMIVEYGTSYSRGTDSITGGATTTAVSCTVGGGVCATSFSATAGTPLFYRYKIRNTANAVLITQPVISYLPQ